MKNRFPFTPLQQGMYLASSQSGRRGCYVEQILCTLKTDHIDVPRLAAAWTALAADCPVLRCVIESDGPGALMQSVHDPAPVDIAVRDWRHSDNDRAQADLDAFLAADRRAGVDALRFPAFRLTLIHLPGHASRLVWTFPHSLLDGRSFAPLLAEAFRRYEDPDSFRPAQSLDAVSGDGFERHCRALSALDHTAGLNHFAKVLIGWEGAFGLVDDHMAPGRKRQVPSRLDAPTVRGLDRLAAACGATLGTVVQAAWGVVTARLAGRDDTVFGVTVSGRHLVEACADAPGCFISTVPMRLRLHRNLTVGALLSGLRADQLAMRPYVHTPLVDIRRRTDMPPGARLFDTLVMYETATLNDRMVALGGRWVDRRVEVLEEGGEPITLAAYRRGDGLDLVLEYDAGQVPEGPRLAAGLQRFLTALAGAGSDTPLAAVSMLAPDETMRLQGLAGPGTRVEGSCLDAFAAALAQCPDRVAICQPETEPLSYAALDRAANRLAHGLIEAGVQAGDLVGICAARGPSFVTAMLATWKIGAAFVPLDPGYPEVTLAMICADSGARLVLVDDSAPSLPAATLSLARMLERDLPDDAPPRSAEGPERLAYVIFTSGSSGRPKGVMVSQAALVAHARAAIAAYGLRPADRVLQFAALSFDVALEEIVPTLLAGATLVLRSDAMARSTSAFLDGCAALGVTVLNLPTGFWVALTEALDHDSDPRLPDAVRLVVVGGERVPMPVLRRWHARVPDVAWINGYGPTEATITCTSYALSGAPSAGDSVPIGGPMAHAQAWVLAADGALAPEGSEGELWIAGPALADGYIGAPERTAAAFAPMRFADAAQRGYGTGDRVVWREGLLHFVGRTDRQIKLRGFRIEPGQIERLLESHPGVARAHAGLVADAPGGPRLVAWVASDHGVQGLDLAALDAALARALPRHMRPVLIEVDDWPQTPGGKTDVARLPAPTLVPPVDAPVETSALAGEIAAMMADLLGTGPVAGTLSFFDLGGDSLSLLRLLTRVEQRFGIRLKPAALYADPTANGIARALAERETDPLVVMPIQPQGDLAPLYAVHVLGDNGSYFRPLAQALGLAQPLFGLTVGLLSPETPTNIGEIASFYMRQIERHRPEGPLSLIAVSMGSYVALELAQQLRKAGREVESLILLDSEGPGGRPRGPRLTRLAVHLGLLRRQGRAYVLRVITEKRAELSHALARLRMALGSRGTTDGPPVRTVEDFIAANALSVRAYVPQPYDRRITVVRAADNLFDSEQARRTGLGWQPVATAGFDLWEVPGDHLGILDAPNVEKLADLLRRQGAHPGR